LIFVEGETFSSPDILSKQEFKDESKLEQNWEQISGGDDYITFNAKFDHIDMRKKPKDTMFDKNEFLSEVFPPLRIQKPGYDVYARTTFALMLIVLFIFGFYTKFTVKTISSVNLSSWATGESEILKGEMAVLLIVILTVICIERYASRTDTKTVVEVRKKYLPG